MRLGQHKAGYVRNINCIIIIIIIKAYACAKYIFAPSVATTLYAKLIILEKAIFITSNLENGICIFLNKSLPRDK